MPRQTNASEFNNFVAGLVTEASPLNFPANSSLDEQNFILRRDGSRRRRLGIDFEPNSVDITTNIPVPASGEVALKTYQWNNAGGDPRRVIIVVQVGNELRFFDANSVPLSTGLIFTKVFSVGLVNTPFSFASVDGLLIVASGEPEINVFEYKAGVISNTTDRLLVRDLFGVEDIVNGTNLREGSGITTRPATRTDAHIYNLRNQTWAEPRKIVEDESVVDLINNFAANGSTFPSNSDVVTYSIYPDANDEDDRLTERFNWKDVRNNPVGSSPAPKGYFIIDALARGPSRLAQAQKLYSENTQLVYPIVSLPQDTTPGGATVVAEYAGRVFYGGFSGEVIGGGR